MRFLTDTNRNDNKFKILIIGERDPSLPLGMTQLVEGKGIERAGPAGSLNPLLPKRMSFRMNPPTGREMRNLLNIIIHLNESR